MSDFLEIENHGEAEARSICILLDGQSINNHPQIVEGQKAITHIGSKTKVRYILKIYCRDPLPSEIEMSWEDDTEEKGHFASSLTI